MRIDVPAFVKLQRNYNSISTKFENVISFACATRSLYVHVPAHANIPSTSKPTSSQSADFPIINMTKKMLTAKEPPLISGRAEYHMIHIYADKCS